MKELRDHLNACFLNLPSKPFFAAKKTDDASLLRLLGSLAPQEPAKPLIRMGSTDDGGYLVPDDLDGITTCFSPGVNDVSDFELDCAQRGMEVYMTDASVDAPAAVHERFNFQKKFLGSYTHAEFITVEEWINLADPNQEGDWIMQMDIEGAEYEVILNMPESFLRKTRILLVEFHMLDHLFDQRFFELAKRAFGKLLNTHTCVHIHPNNAGSVVSSKNISLPKIMEFTFVRKDRSTTGAYARAFPHPLDVDCVPNFRHVNLPACWQGK